MFIRLLRRLFASERRLKLLILFFYRPRTFLLSRPFLDVAAFVISLKNLTKAGDAEACTGEMNSHKPGANDVG